MKVVLQNLTKKFPNRNKKAHDDVIAVNDFTFEIPDGTLIGLLGPSGCGKTTTGRSIIKLYNITSGSIYYKGVRISAGNRWNRKEIKFTKIRAKNKISELLEAKKQELATVQPGTIEYKEIADKYRFAFKMVTLDGDVFAPQGSMTGGSRRKDTVGLLSSDRKIEENDIIYEGGKYE